MSLRWATRSATAVIAELDTHQSRGLTTTEARRRFKRDGPNALPEPPRDSILVVFARQFASPLIYVLVAAAVVVYFLGESVDSVIIAIVLLFNAIVGTIQEGRAQHTLAALKRLATTAATVIRDGRPQRISDRQLVVGDIIELREGEQVPADARIIAVSNLSVNESSLTGEVIPVHKTVALKDDIPPSGDVPLGDLTTMVFKGTFVTGGQGKMVVVATGSNTELGKVSRSIIEHQTEIPLQGRVRVLVNYILAVVAIGAAAIFVLGVWRGHAPATMFATVVSLAVSAVPEGLPVVLTLVLATGLWRMSRNNALVKKLAAVEALGQTTIIAIDKTGTITKNELMVTQVWTHGRQFEVEGEGYTPSGRILENGAPIEARDFPQLARAGEVAALMSLASLTHDESAGRWNVSGDPTEAALTVLGQKMGFSRDALLRKIPLRSESPFDYATKLHTLVRGTRRSWQEIIVGAPEAVIAHCRLDAKGRGPIVAAVNSMADRGLRVVAFATRTTKHRPHVFGGLYGISDTLHTEVLSVVQKIQTARIQLVLITGDHRRTAQAIAKRAGIYRDGDEVLTGEDLATLTPAQLRRRLPKVTVFARVSPQDKQTIISAYQSLGHTVAMTGDGVNDAPSLVAADLGVAMGRQGTEVAKEAGDIILLDDNLRSIVAAIEEGRSIYRTIQKVILYLFSTSLGEVVIIAGALAANAPLLITPSQIIWLNFVTDGFLTAALAMEPREEGLLDEKWRNSQLVTRAMWWRMVVMAIVMGMVVLAVYPKSDAEASRRASSVVLTLLAVLQWYNAWNCRHERRSVIGHAEGGNRWLMAATAVVVGLQLAALHLPVLNDVLHTEPLALADWLIVLVLGSIILWVEELAKIWRRRDRATS